MLPSQCNVEREDSCATSSLGLDAAVQSTHPPISILRDSRNNFRSNSFNVTDGVSLLWEEMALPE